MTASVQKWPHATRQARTKPCTRCPAWLLYGLDDDRAGSAVEVDLAPVAYLEAVVAVLSGRAVFALSGVVGVAARLWWLDVTELRNGGPSHPLHLEHRCARTLDHLMPAPAAMPFTAAITGRSRLRIWRTTGL